MKQLLRETTAYRRYARDAAAGETSHTTLIVFPDETYLRALLKECAKALFGAEDGSRAAKLIDGESFADCIILPAAGEKPSVEMAEAVVDGSVLRPLESDKKLFVLDVFHTAPALVQNKLLKVLEEPPANVYFLLGASSEQAVLPTVLSRAKRIAEAPFTEKQIEDALRRGHVREEGIREAAAACGGIYSVAENLLAGGGETFALAEQFLEAENIEALCRKLGEIKEKREFLAAVKLVLRDAMMLAAGREDACARRSPATCRIAAKYPVGVLVRAVGHVGACEREVNFNANLGQAALALAVRIREDEKTWQTLS